MKPVVIIFLLVLLGCDRNTDYKYKLQAPSLSGEFRTMNNRGLSRYFEIAFTEAPWEGGRNFPARCVGNFKPLILGKRQEIGAHGLNIIELDRNRAGLSIHRCYDFDGEKMPLFKFAIIVQNSVPINYDHLPPLERRGHTPHDGELSDDASYTDLASHIQWGQKDSFIVDITIKDIVDGDQIELTEVEVEKI